MNLKGPGPRGRGPSISPAAGSADKTGAKVIGEGLDTLEELALLGELGIDYGQGWLFGHPHPLRAGDLDGDA